MKIFYLCINLYVFVYVEIKALPVVVDVTKFDDPWDYKIALFNDPILNGSTRNHILPSFTKRKGKQPSFEDLEAHKAEARASSKEIGDSVRRKVSCATCRLGILLLQGEVRRGTSLEDIKDKFVSICVGFNIENEIVCSGVFDVYAHDLLPALNVTQIGAQEVCSLSLGEVCGDVENPIHEWEIELPDVPKPEVKELDPPDLDAPVFKVLHISDTHFDPNYEEGSPANCQEPLCCHSYSSPMENEPMQPAQKWGSYAKCDSPRILIENMFKHISEKHPDIDYIIWTGDLPPHDIWNQTRESNLDILKETVKQMAEAFPNTLIFPALGNHESAPAGSFPPPWVKDEDHSISWLYDALSTQWNRWLPTETNNTLIHGGFYSVLLRPGFRLISVNMNYCHNINWWLLINSTDPAKELKWLMYELQDAENKGEKVHIIGHIPPGDADCLKTWSRNYYKIVERYESTIVAQFFGHRHTDEFEIFFDTKEHARPTGIAYVGPSVTTFENLNPGYRIYYVDGDHNNTTREVVEHESWVMDLEKANKDDNPEWLRLYTAREAYGFTTLRPKEWSHLINKMAVDPKLFDLFYRFYYKDSPERPDCNDNQCRLQILCDLKSGKSHDRRHLCHDLEDILRS